MKNPTVKYVYDDPGVVELGLSSVMRGMLKVHAKEAKQAAERNSPYDSGEYKSAFYIAEATIPAGRYHKPRAAVLVGNTSPYAHIVESRKRVLRNALAVAEVGK